MSLFLAGYQNAVGWVGDIPTYVIVIIAPTVIYAAMMGAWRLVFGEWIG